MDGVKKQVKITQLVYIQKKISIFAINIIDLIQQLTEYKNKKMRKIVLFGILLFSTLSYGQLKQTKLTDREIDMLGSRIHSFSKGGNFYYQEIKDNKLQNLLGFIAEFQYREKTIAKIFMQVKYLLGSGETMLNLSFFKMVDVCLKTKDLSDNILIDFLKKGWRAEEAGGDEEYICGGRLNIFTQDESGYYKLKGLANGEIKIVLYKIEMD